LAANDRVLVKPDERVSGERQLSLSTRPKAARLDSANTGQNSN
jgi:hypothetical protein